MSTLLTPGLSRPTTSSGCPTNLGAPLGDGVRPEGPSGPGRPESEVVDRSWLALRRVGRGDPGEGRAQPVYLPVSTPRPPDPRRGLGQVYGNVPYLVVSRDKSKVGTSRRERPVPLCMYVY